MDKRVIKILKNPLFLFMTFGHRGWFNWISDEKYLKIVYRISMSKKLQLDNPQTYSEKLQWLKLYDRKPEYTMMVDKYEVKEYVAGIIGEEHIIPTLGVWDKFEEIDFDTLPNRFVLKCTHDSGGLVICKDKSKLNKKKAQSILNGCLKNNYYWGNREWPYKNVKRRILAEQYIEPSPETNDLPDFKFFCFNGEPKFCQVISGRNAEMSIDFFDKDWNHQPFHEPSNYPFANPTPTCPKHLDYMWEAARKLAVGKPFSRIDFYDVNDKVYFGEITFFPTSGMGGFDPEDWDYQFGSWINLPK